MQERLLAWYAGHGRDLPWRGTRDPYAILVSEVMLQQTQVSRVVPRYLSWLERWPNVDSLAEASRADVIRAWQGLGYNRRGLALHRASRMIAERGWPNDLTDLPGVGRYTAAAIENFAFGRPVLPVDVNVDRVLARTGREFRPEAAQALFDLGATVCLARVPRCGACPLAADCPSAGRRYEPGRRQSPFEGSFRQRRARVLRLVAEEPQRVTVDPEAVDALVADGLVVVEDGRARLPGVTPYDGLIEALRTAARPDRPAPEDFAAYLEKVRTRAYTVTDADIEALRTAGHSEDEIFELTVSAAVGSGLLRLRAGLEAMGLEQDA